MKLCCELVVAKSCGIMYKLFSKQNLYEGTKFIRACFFWDTGYKMSACTNGKISLMMSTYLR